MVAKVKPRFVKPKDLASGETAFYWEVPGLLSGPRLHDPK
jgi:hypothetical protein